MWLYFVESTIDAGFNSSCFTCCVALDKALILNTIVVFLQPVLLSQYCGVDKQLCQHCGVDTQHSQCIVLSCSSVSAVGWTNSSVSAVD